MVLDTTVEELTNQNACYDEDTQQHNIDDEKIRAFQVKEIHETPLVVEINSIAWAIEP
jgi:hypothetical protein